jgi:hypothetical protein
MADSADKTTLRICAECRHHRRQKPIDPFSQSALWTPGALEAKLAWDRDLQERAMLEAQRFDAGAPFDFEPLSLSWCHRWTEIEDRVTVDPVSGVRRKIYILCGYANADGMCVQFEGDER